MQQYAVWFILLQNHSICFGCPTHPSSGVLKTVTAASGTSHNIGTATSLQRGQIGTVPIYGGLEISSRQIRKISYQSTVLASHIAASEIRAVGHSCSTSPEGPAGRHYEPNSSFSHNDLWSCLQIGQNKYNSLLRRKYS